MCAPSGINSMGFFDYLNIEQPCTTAVFGNGYDNGISILIPALLLGIIILLHYYLQNRNHWKDNL